MKKYFKKTSHILILTNTLKTGGAEKQSILLYNALSHYYSTKLIVYYGDQKDKRMIDLLDNKSDNVIFLKGNHFNKLLFLYRFFKSNPNSICISYLATTNFINGIVGKLSGIKIRIGGIRSSRYGFLKFYLQRHLYNHWLSGSVFNNYLAFNTLTSKGFNNKKGRVIYNSILVPEYNYFTNPNNSITILSVGRFVEAKDYFTALQAIKILIRKGKSIKYIIVGQGHLEKELRFFINKNQLNTTVELVINPPNVEKFYSESDIYLSTSIFEGMSNSIMEAMSYGLPVVATDVGDNKILIHDKETGFLVKPKEVIEIAERLELLINNSDLRKKMSNNGYQFIKSNFSIEKFRENYINLFEELLNENR